MPRKRTPRKRAHGSVQQRGGSWRVRWTQNGRRRTESYPDKDTAERVLSRILGDIAAGRGKLEVEKPPAPLLSKLAEDWLERREATHRSADEDRWRWNKHLGPTFGHQRPEEVDAAAIRRFIEAKLVEGLSSSTVRLLVRELSSLFSDIVEQGHAPLNPVRTLPRATRRLIRPAHDPRTTPFVERLDDVRRIFLALPEPINLAYALGALAGLRNGEALALRWAHVDMSARRLHVRESVEGPLKDIDSRVVPIQDALHPLLAQWKLRSKGEGRVVPAMRSDGEFLDSHTLRKHLADVLPKLELPLITWYQATRHTFASQWILAGQGIETLREIMGHSTVQVTERYAHLRPDMFGPTHRGALKISLAPGAERPGRIGATVGPDNGSATEEVA
jgi:integrase